jgi:uncharacterized protein
MGNALYDPGDPRAQARDYDDSRFTLDHFSTKLLHLAQGFQTPTGSQLAEVRHQRLQRFMDELLEEIGA